MTFHKLKFNRSTQFEGTGWLDVMESEQSSSFSQVFHPESFQLSRMC